MNAPAYHSQTAALSIHDAPQTSDLHIHAVSAGSFAALTIGRNLAQTSVTWFLADSDLAPTAAVLRKAADALDAAIVEMRESDLFRCPKCGEHFTGKIPEPVCANYACHYEKGVNVPEDTPYCGTCNLGLEPGDELDEDGCCPACA